MTIRMRWNIEESEHAPLRRHDGFWQNLLGGEGLTAHFQPIYAATSHAIFGYEALARFTGEAIFANMDSLFNQALEDGTSAALDLHCREKALRQAGIHGLPAQEAFLFLNICPETMTDPAYESGHTNRLADQYGIPRERIVLEITEKAMVRCYDTFSRAVQHYRDQGYRIAIDDFGAGYGGLKMLSIIEPDFIKIDRHFVRDIDKAIIKYNLVDAITTACHRIGIQVIAEGVEDAHDLRICYDLGIQLLQGYFIARPAPELVPLDEIRLPQMRPRKSQTPSWDDETRIVQNIAETVEPLRHDDQVLTALNRFKDEPGLFCLPVIEDRRIRGLVNRHRFMEQHMVGTYGYGFSLNYYRTIPNVMEEQILQVEENLTIEELAEKLHLRSAETVYDDICVTRNGFYLGMVSVKSLLEAVTRNNLLLARGANPLTGLPGNEYIQREISRLITKSAHFDICYVDIDHFKPFNDHYGFERGDKVIRDLGALLSEVLASQDCDDICFVGHIGGDDFILVTRPRTSLPCCEEVVRRFTERLPEFHDAQDVLRGSYQGIHRNGDMQDIPLLSLSIGIVSTEVFRIASYAEASSRASEVKHLAKARPGSAIVRDRRLHDEHSAPSYLPN
ncbi:MAG: hypothetical protein BWK76_01995 [Desulfobulbaceae bacterium A2]|nr:MAG: hypothetical protein BWK76_01995 [Desulfobulbaceae bacterium A2]